MTKRRKMPRRKAKPTEQNRDWRRNFVAPLIAPAPTKKRSDQRQVGGEHYKTANPAMQHWNLVVAMGWDYFTSQATKYLFRWPYKGNVEDLKKARHFLDKLIELVEAGWLPDWKGSDAWSEPGCDPTGRYTNQD